MAFFSGFDSPAEVTNDRSGGTTTKWYTVGNGLNFSIANSVLTLNNSLTPGDNEDIKTISGGNATRVSRPGAIVAGDGNGVRFQFGYFEALLKYDPNAIGGGAFPAWWCHGFQSNEGYNGSSQVANSIEFDFLENFGPGGGGSSTGLWNWASKPNITTVDTFATPGWGDQFHPVSQGQANTAAGNWADWAIVGALVTPSRCAVWWNSKARRAVGTADTLIVDVNTTVTYSVSSGNAMFDASRLCDWPLLIGGASPTLQVDYVAVWQ